jgi:hypothetical protein
MYLQVRLIGKEAHPLGQILQYQHPEVVNRIREENDWTMEEAQEVFTDTLRFLYLCSIHKGLAPTKRIDIGWHTFILYTKDYAAFCDIFFGRFMHHVPVARLTKSARPDGSLSATVALAQSVFGNLSRNWGIEPSASCGGETCKFCSEGPKEAVAGCSMSDCTPVSCGHR